jgi:DNA-binding response OmpR family regulator
MSYERNDLLEFGAYQIDVAQRVLQSGSHPIPLAPKVFDTLLALVESPGRIVEKEELLKKSLAGYVRRRRQPDLINALSNVPGLRVAARTTAF